MRLHQDKNTVVLFGSIFKVTPTIGHFSFIHQNHTVGWALMVKQLKTRTAIEFIVDDQFTASSVVSCLHKVLSEKSIIDDHNGFAISLPSAGKREHILPGIYKKSLILGYCTRISSHWVNAWTTVIKSTCCRKMPRYLRSSIHSNPYRCRPGSADFH